ncbi:uncharacterized protein KGF55_004129 [Candida pseudojiufengensis]|uniref:uncharacterized protein n=1 Tax=Candida pseudojiufengensis TaxID=497109 RepID=UPI00222460F6|nr:uncharacterized protein KGF55_004129 [Candida pseudojiufengensis]KAI5961204.1 hypothetical protein KGF55_004129 [Candida pseudojiufengensis]
MNGSMSTSKNSPSKPSTPNSSSILNNNSQTSNGSENNLRNTKNENGSRVSIKLSDLGIKVPSKKNNKSNTNGVGNLNNNNNEPSWQLNKLNSKSPFNKLSSQPQSPQAPQQQQPQLQKRPSRSPLFKSKNRSDTNITSLNLNHNKRKSVSSISTPGSNSITPPLISKSSDNLRNLLDREPPITPPVFEDDSNMSYFNLDKNRRISSGNVNNNFRSKDRRKPSSFNNGNKSNTELLNSPRFIRDFKKSIANNYLNSSSFNSQQHSNSNNPKLQVQKEQKNRLVDQFYNNVPNSPQNNSDLNRILQNNLNDSNESGFLASLQNSNVNLKSMAQGLSSTKNNDIKKFKWDQDEINVDEKMKEFELLQQNQPPKSGHSTTTTNNMPFDLKASEDLVFSILNNGGFSFQYDVKHVIEDDKLVNYLINIDNIIDDYMKSKNSNHSNNQNLNDDAMNQLTKIISSISDKIMMKSKLLIHSKSNPIKMSILQLNIISNYLINLNLDIKNLKNYLITNLENTKNENKEIIIKSLNKLDNINENLINFENKSNFYKDKISNSKNYMNDEINKKIKLLESINIKIQNQKNLNKTKNYLKLNCLIIIGFILFVGVWIYKR